MKKILFLLTFFLPLCAQEIKLPASLEKLAQKAVESAQVTLDSNLLQLAAKFLSADKPDEARVKKLVSGIKRVYVRTFEFDKPGAYSESDVNSIRSQLQAPGWSKIVDVVTKRERESENAEIYTKTEQGKIAGLVILSAEPTELTFIHIDGNIDLDQLSDLGGRFGIPKLEVGKTKKTSKD